MYTVQKTKITFEIIQLLQIHSLDFIWEYLKSEDVIDVKG